MAELMLGFLAFTLLVLVVVAAVIWGLDALLTPPPRGLRARRQPAGDADEGGPGSLQVSPAVRAWRTRVRLSRWAGIGVAVLFMMLVWMYFGAGPSVAQTLLAGLLLGALGGELASGRRARSAPRRAALVNRERDDYVDRRLVRAVRVLGWSVVALGIAESFRLDHDSAYGMDTSGPQILVFFVPWNDMTGVMLIWILALLAVVASELLWRRVVRRPWVVQADGDELADAMVRAESAQVGAWTALGLLLVLAASAVEELPRLFGGHSDPSLPGGSLAGAVAVLLVFIGIGTWVVGTRRAVSAPSVPAALDAAP